MANQINSTDNKRKHEAELLDDQNEKNLQLDESYVTMVDVLKEEEMLEEDAHAVLGGSDDKNCTFEQGYINRQALYSCRTCMANNSDDIFGICLACSYACHADHELFELYTKRSFRCDCGTKRMKNGKCTLSIDDKDTLNELNKYNHNFIGNYCLCDKPYPNLDGKDEQMVQCAVCEDWFHENCLKCNFPDDEDYSEMICKNCMKNNQFLNFYQTEKIKLIKSEENVKIDVELVENKNDENVKTEDKQEEVQKDSDMNGEERKDGDKKDDEKKDEDKKVEDMKVEDKKFEDKKDEDMKENNLATEKKVTETVSNTIEESKNEQIEVENGDEQSKDDATKNCKLEILKKLKANVEDKKIDTTFWDEGWRSQLCRCEDCLTMYAKNKIEFLINENDTVHFYEAKGKENCQKISQYERGLNEINKMGHVASIEAIMEFNNMSDKFKEHFKKFADDKKVIAQKDIEEFFQNLKYKKKMKLNDNPF